MKNYWRTTIQTVFTVLIGIFAVFPVFAQLDSVHFIPPMHARGEWGPQYLYITTPETTPFKITITDGTGIVLSILDISNSSPQRYSIGASNSTPTLVTEQELNTPLDSKGIKVRGDKKFYVNFRAHSDSKFQACDLTSKGLGALGKTFRTGQMIQGASTSSGRSNFIGIMAVEDNTVISLSEYDTGVRFRINGSDVQVPAPLQFIINAGQCYVISQYVTNSASYQPPNGMIGALLSSDKPIAVNVGSWTGAPVTEAANDIGIDQIVPVELVGEEYILCKGNGGNVIEIPYVVAHTNGTKVWLNGSTIPAATLNAGQYYQIPTSDYTSSGNLYIVTSMPTFVYQVIGGVANSDDEKRTGGLIFVPPISCGIPNAVDNIYQPNQIGEVKYDGGLMITAMKDSIVTLRIDGTIVPLGTADPVQGNPDFVTYRRLNLFSISNPPTVASVIAQGAIQVAYFGRNGAAGFGGFYSGFSKVNKPNISLKLKGDGVCPDTLEATGKFDGVQWYYADSLLQYGPDSTFIVYAPGLYTARGYLGVCRRTDFEEDTTTVPFFNSPKFPYSTTPPSCYGFTNAAIEFGMPTGGLEPYQYSIDNGFEYSYSPDIQGLAAGDYTLVVKDSTGCYNYPIDISIGQPDSLGVKAEILRIDEPLLSGESVLLGSSATREIINTVWMPDSTQCSNCPQITVAPKETTWYTVTVTDSFGCTATDRVQLVIQPNIYAPNVFQPGADKGNDVFLLFSKDPVMVNWLRIYDRWGNLLFEKRNFFTNDPSSGWDGSFSGKLLNPGVFIYSAEIEHVPGRKFNVNGDITLVR